ncbi:MULTISPECIES: hypothetical protein [Chitinophaga]|uniref:hypothetical protein n=1 Tax=Chitinophaga TaxID=79328 RepID=UPI000DBA7184|nr:hypothetical protein [Chitinophaga ginsengisegetis]MDR6567711.1 hypothetical protein [Chitinophaga ginsengisegetis]MDR6647734.1 hypothetical protein [Chitinophaga ginsengisegetis]MDR6654084.1 hypothetical protein [Chitinophaga ginsengisegetis]
MTIKKSTSEKRELKETKRKNEALAPAKGGAKKERNDDRNNVLEGYDEDEYDQKDIADSKRRKKSQG